MALTLVWIGGQPHQANIPTQSASASLAAVQAAEHVATVSAAGKIQRIPEFRHGGDPDFVALLAETYPGTSGLYRHVSPCGADAPRGLCLHTRPEPRAPPVI
ncbi:hypothetical protein [Pseudotabrizicola sp. 4114]|uniref:hypothetical protein n=1 Tax=Pseudotabrizicola sp. 4114 TaxID=2817731 RepID=UPI0028551EA3|nr:hypothetical protein [Pseudorhodobacter sp. 4114]